MVKGGAVIDIDGHGIHLFYLGIHLGLKGNCLIVQGGQLLTDENI
jgi:hypothetical protein